MFVLLILLVETGEEVDSDPGDETGRSWLVPLLLGCAVVVLTVGAVGMWTVGRRRRRRERKHHGGHRGAHRKGEAKHEQHASTIKTDHSTMKDQDHVHSTNKGHPIENKHSSDKHRTHSTMKGHKEGMKEVKQPSTQDIKDVVTSSTDV